MLQLKNFKKVTENSQKNGRISLDDFKKNTSKEEGIIDLEKLTGGILGACHIVVNGQHYDNGGSGVLYFLIR